MENSKRAEGTRNVNNDSEAITPEVIGLKLTPSQIKAYGCATCFYKSMESCPKGYKKEESDPHFICAEYYRTLSDFAGKSGSVNVMLEQMSLFLADMQQRQDYMEMKELERKMKYAEENGMTRTADYEIISQKHAVLKMIFNKFNDGVTKGYSRVNDREQRRDTGLQTGQTKISLTQIHNIMNYQPKQIEGKNDE